MFKKKRISLDHATSTSVRKEVLDTMQPYWNENYGNPGTIHQDGVIAKKALDDSRKKVSGVLKCHSDEIVFTANGTESNSLAVFGLLNRVEDLSQMHIITTIMEHPSILKWFSKDEEKGVQVSYIDIDENGFVDLKELREELKESTIFVSIMYANNEIETIQPITKISHILRKFNLEIVFRSAEIFCLQKISTATDILAETKTKSADFGIIFVFQLFFV